MDSKYNKAYAVGQYVHSLGLSVGEMMQRGDHKEYTWNSSGANNPYPHERMEITDDGYRLIFTVIGFISGYATALLFL